MATRGRKAIEIDRVAFQDTVKVLELENGGSFNNRSELWAAVANSEWAKNLKPRPLTPQVAMLKADALNISVNTPKAKRGRQAGQLVPTGGKRKQRKVDENAIAELRKETGVVNLKVVDRVAKGSLKAAIKLKCIDCSGGSKKEVALCPCVACPLYTVRPYRDKKSQAIARAEETVEA